MFFITIKLLLATFVGSIILLAIRGALKAKEYRDCPRCEKGYCYGIRGREKCETCRGSGQVKRKEWEDQ